MSATDPGPVVHGLPEAGLRSLLPLGRRLARRRWDVHVTSPEHVPAAGPVILAANHLGWLDGPLLVSTAPRPSHALVKREVFVGRTGRLLRYVQQIPLHRELIDTGAARTALRVLRSGQVLVIFPESVRGAGTVERTKPGAAWLALVTGAPIVPVALFGTRLPGAGPDDLPPPGTRLDVVYGEPLHTAPQPWPRDAGTIEDAEVRVREHLASHVARASSALGLQLPGPLPTEESRRA